MLAESWCLFAMVLSDDLRFLSTLTKTCFETRLLEGLTKFFAFTQLEMHRLSTVHKSLSLTNSLMGIIDYGPKGMRSVKCYACVTIQTIGETRTVR